MSTVGTIKIAPPCGACGSGASWGPGNCTNAFGNEWDYVGENGCNYNCIVGGIFPGTQAQCQMTRYLADQTKCCLGTNSSGTCNPAWTISSGQCDSALSAYCSQGNNIVSDPKCKNWVN